MIGTQADYARHAGISKQAVNKLVKKRTIQLRPDGKVDFAAADHARRVNADPARQLVDDAAAKPVAADLASPEQLSFSAHRAEREQYQAQLARLDLETRLGKLLSKDEVENAMVQSGRTIRRSLDGMVGWADELTAAARQHGVDGVRSLLKAKLRGLEQTIADSLNLLGGEDDK